MGRPVRLYIQDGTYFVTARVTQQRMLLRPSTSTNELVGGVLAKAVSRFPVQLYGFVFTSNHVHLLLRASDGCLSAFMQFLLGNLARKVGRVVDWRGTFWERRFSAEPVLDDEATENRLKYILAHGVKEGLVRRVTDWPGLSCVHQLLGDSRRAFTWFHWALRWQRRRLRTDALGLFDEALAEDVELQLSAIPSWAGLSAQERRRRAEALIEEIETEGRQQHRNVRGVRHVRAQPPQRRPRRASHSPRPLCHASTRDAWWSWLCQYKAFRYAYQLASRRYREGEADVVFPPLSFRPPLIRGVTTTLVAA